MSDEQHPITTGRAINGQSGVLNVPFYTGPVGVRDRDGISEAAYFGPLPTIGLPVDGTLDGQPVRILALQSRGLAFGADRRVRADDIRAITLTITAR